MQLLSPALIPFCKVETVGNDFVLVRRDEVGDHDLAALARALCRRRFSVGSDGLIVEWREGDQIHLRFFNPDGTEDFCGNGLRCAAWYAFRQGWVGTEFEIHQLGEIIPMQVWPDGRVRAKMPAAEYSPSAVPHLGGSEWINRALHGLKGTALTTGSAHFIAFVEELPTDEEFFRLGPLIENDPIFPERISVMWVRADSNRRLSMRIWERGVGETLGCGTGASASASAWSRLHGVTGQIEVWSKGGRLLIDLDRWDSPMFVESEPEDLFYGVAEIDPSLHVIR